MFSNTPATVEQSRVNLASAGATNNRGKAPKPGARRDWPARGTELSRVGNRVQPTNRTIVEKHGTLRYVSLWRCAICFGKSGRKISNGCLSWKTPCPSLHWKQSAGYLSFSPPNKPLLLESDPCTPKNGVQSKDLQTVNLLASNVWTVDMHWRARDRKLVPQSSLHVLHQGTNEQWPNTWESWALDFFGDEGGVKMVTQRYHEQQHLTLKLIPKQNNRYLGSLCMCFL